MKLFNLVIKGRTLHFEGDLHEALYDPVERLANEIKHDPNDIGFEKYSEQFAEEVKKRFGVELKRKNIDAIFRVRSEFV